MPGAPGWLPATLRVEGFELGSPEAQVLANHFAGSLRQFYNQQSQNHRASGLAQWAHTVDRGDHQMRYVGQGAIETMTLQVHQQVAEGLTKQTKTSIPWDFAIIDFTFDGVVQQRHVSGRPWSDPVDTPVNIGPAAFYAQCVSPRVDPNPDPTYEYEFGAADIGGANRTFSAEGLQTNPFDTTNARPMVDWATFPVETNSGSGTRTGVSLKLDVRLLQIHKTVVFDVYGSTARFQDDALYVYTETRSGAVFDHATGYLYDDGTTSVAQVYYYHPGLEAEFVALYPIPDGYTPESYAAFLGGSAEVLTLDFYEETLVPVDTPTNSLELAGVLVRKSEKSWNDDWAWEAVRFETPDGFRQDLWYQVGIRPRFDVKDLGAVTIGGYTPLQDDVPGQWRYGSPKLGQVIVDVEHGALSFKPA